jgi:hypothetical protein
MTRRLIVPLAILVLTACTDTGRSNAGDLDLAALQSKYLELQRQVDDMSGRMIELDRRLDDTAFFRPSSQGQQVVWVANGFLYVQVKDLKPEKDGYRVVFEVGNPMYATFRAVRATVSWGLPDLRSPAAETEVTPTHSVDCQMKQDLHPGAVVPVSVLMHPATGDDIASFSIRLIASSATLSKR